MSQCLIYYIQGGASNAANWVIQYSGSVDYYYFMGENASDQLQRIQVVADAMKKYDEDPELLYDAVSTYIIYPVDIYPLPNDFVDMMFQNSSELLFSEVLMGEVAPAGESLLDVIEAAGEDLFEAVALLL